LVDFNPFPPRGEVTVGPPVELLSKLLWVRDSAALPDRALADLLGLEARRLNALVQAHPERFAEELVFRLTSEERQHIRDAPVLAFTEAGLALLVGQLGQDAQVLALLPRFAEARHFLTSQAVLSVRVEALEQKLEAILQALKAESEAEEHHRPIGFLGDELPAGPKPRERQGRKLKP
jgi:hypothetical protein